MEKLLTARLEADLEACRVAGAHLLVTQEGKPVADICRGTQNPLTGAPLRRDAMYRLASMTKPVSGWSLGVQVTDREGILPVGAFGWSGAYGTHFWVDPINQITAIYMRGSRFYDSHGCGTVGIRFERDVMACLEP